MPGEIVSEPTSHPSGKGIEQLLIASALQPELCRRLLENPEDVFPEFDLTEEHKDILRHIDHRLLDVLGAVVVRKFESSTGVGDAPATAPAPHAVIAATKLPDSLLALTVAPYAQFEGDRFLGFAYAVWVNPIPEGTDPASVPPPPAASQVAGRPLPPLRAVIQVSAAQLPDAGGHPQVGLWAALRQSSNVSAPPAPETSGRTENESHSEAVHAAAAAVRQAPAHERFDRVIDLMRELRSEAAR